MSDPVRAAVPRFARETIAARAPDADILLLEELGADGLAGAGVAFLVPIPHRQAELVDHLAEMDGLRVVQTLSAGVDKLDDAVPAGVTLCSARGARDGAVAEWVMGALLGASTRVAQCARDRTWVRGMGIGDIAGATVLVLGMGSIGRAVQARLEPFGAEVVGVASHARDDLHGVAELPDLLPRADAVIVLTPLTDATHGLLDADALALLPDDAVVINAGRGPVIDTDALLAETARGRLRAILDVTDPEPLPEDHPLWDAPGVLCITPHVAGNSPNANRLAAELAGDQLARFAAGEPLRNIVVDGSA